MSWDDIEEILCNGHIEFEFFCKSSSLVFRCSKCGITVKGHGCINIPNCVKCFGSKAII